MSGLDIVFDWSFDGSAWPGPAASSVGEAWLGPQGLLDRLELELGLGARHVTQLERAIALSRTLGAGFWARSLEADPIATARRLLEDRDLLVSWGWRGEPAGERLGSLWAATLEAHPGIPDRLHVVIDHAARERVEIARIRCCEPVENYPPIWRRLFLVLGSSGVSVEVRPPQSFSAGGDLRGSRATGFTPTGDGSLQLFRPHGVLAAADTIAAVLAAAPDDGSTVVIGPDAILDASLEHYRVPRLGADRATPGSAALLRACIESAFTPADTADLHALVCADPGPVPRNVAWALSSALCTLSGRGSDAWREGLTTQLALLAEDARTSVAERLKMLLDPVAGRDDRIPFATLEARLGVLENWARGRDLDELAMRTRAFLRLLRGTTDASRNELLRLCDELDSPTVAGETGQVGLQSVIVPGAIVGATSTVIWWGFTRDRAPCVPRMRLSNVERAALGDAAPDLGAIMAAEARRWRRPLELATHTLVFVCPRTDAVGDLAHPHPLWDELVAAMPEPARQSRLVTEDPVLRGGAAQRRVVRSRPLPIAFETAAAPAPLALRVRESASSLSDLMGCSLAYLLHYVGRIRSRLAGPPVEPGPLLYGNVAHVVLARTFAPDSTSPTDAGERAEAVFDQLLPNIAEPLLLPDHHAERAMLRRAVTESACLVASILESTGGHIRGLEHVLEGAFGPASVESRADLVLATPDHVIDFKWGTSGHRDALRNGAAVQLAIYAALLGPGAGAAYLSVRDRRVLAARGSGISLGSEPGDYGVDDMIAAVIGALELRVAELVHGRLVAPGALGDPPRSRIDEGVLRLAPDCGICELGAFCGRRGRA